MATPTATWYELSAHHGVLELDEAATPDGLALELHLSFEGDAPTAAWWEAEDGTWLANAVVGSA